ncbi:MAG: rod-binding protein [Pseudomonadota bacterium]
MADPLLSSAAVSPGVPSPQRQPAASLEAAAQGFEAVFLTEMLKHAGLGQARNAFGGGPGEAGFSGMLVREYAQAIAATGTTGIAEAVARRLATLTGADT